jgi:hypothetical protein
MLLKILQTTLSANGRITSYFNENIHTTTLRNVKLPKFQNLTGKKKKTSCTKCDKNKHHKSKHFTKNHQRWLYMLKTCQRKLTCLKHIGLN